MQGNITKWQLVHRCLKRLKFCKACLPRFSVKNAISDQTQFIFFYIHSQCQLWRYLGRLAVVCWMLLPSLNKVVTYFLELVGKPLHFGLVISTLSLGSDKSSYLSPILGINSFFTAVKILSSCIGLVTWCFCFLFIVAFASVYKCFLHAICLSVCIVCSYTTCMWPEIIFNKVLFCSVL